VALLLIPLFAMVAFAVDAGWVVLAQSDLQSAADAAALAGAQQLLGQQTLNSATGRYYLANGFTQYYLTGQTQQSAIVNAATAAASKSAKDFANYGAAGTVKSLTLLDSDIEFGKTEASGAYTKLTPPYSTFPNTVKVTLRLDSNANNPLPLFFAPVIGTKTASLTATASATIYAGTINSFQTGGTLNSGILPMTYDQAHWNYFLQNGKSIDGVTSLDANGVPQLSVYPSIKYAGNFGLLSLDDSSDGASSLSTWINNGLGSSDIQTLLNANLMPLSAHDVTQWDWHGDSGLRDSDIQAIQPHVGDTFLLPLYKALNSGVDSNGNVDPSSYQAGSGQGTNYNFNIVQFVGVRIIQADNTGNNKSVVVQPAAVTDPNAVFTNVNPASAPSSGSSALVTTFTSAKLTR
jgi:Flp pilus assembly protein TadG